LQIDKISKTQKRNFVEEKEENLVKKTCRELGITQKELAKYFGVTPKTVSDWAVERYKLPSNFNLIIDLINSKQELEILKRVIKS
jgi:DNA-binding transcriptional regulator YiaG